MYVHKTPFYIFVNQIVCVDTKYTCLALSMLHMAVITNDILKYSTRERIQLAFHWLYVWPFFSCFHRGKYRLLYFYIYISLIDPIFTFSLQPDILCNCCSWAQHNIGHSTSNVELTPSSVARIKLDGASGCAVTREALVLFTILMFEHKYHGLRTVDVWWMTTVISNIIISVWLKYVVYWISSN